MPLFIFFVALILVLMGNGDVHRADVYHYRPVQHEVYAWDREHMQNVRKLQEMNEDFQRKVHYYQDATGQQLSTDEIRHLIKEANRHDVPVEILIKLLKVESNYNTQLVGPPTRYGHAYGIAQFMENTAPWIAKMANLDYEFEYLFDPYYSITLAATYLHYLQYGDDQHHFGYYDWHSTLTAYNRGMGGLDAYVRKHETTRTTFSKRILQLAESITYHVNKSYSTR